MRKLSRWIPLLAVFLMATTSRTQKSPAAPAAANPAKLSPESERWVAQTLKKMSLDEKIGQVFAVWAYGSFMSTESQDYRDLLHDVEQNHIGSFAIQTQGSPLGIVRSQVYPTAVLVNTLQSHAKIPLLVAADFERGTSMRVEEGSSFPHAMAVAATGRPEDAYTMGKITALEGRAVGVPWIFAPDADVNSNPDNPIINTRSFGEDPARVSEFVAAFIRGVEENGGRPGHDLARNHVAHLSCLDDACCRHEPLQVRLLRRPLSPVPLHSAPDPDISFQGLRPAHGPDRHPYRGAGHQVW